MFQKKSNINFLDMVPIRKVTDFIEEEGRITLLVPKFKKEWMVKVLIPSKKSKHFKIHLDEIGSEVWRNINGNRNVSQISSNVAEFLKQKLKNEANLDERITQFLSQLYKNRFIEFEKSK